MAPRKQSVPAFEDTWIECLGHLDKYRMAIEGEDLHNREVLYRYNGRWSHIVTEDTVNRTSEDLARFGLAMEDENVRDREVWTGVARDWYNNAAEKSARISRIQHHVAALARPSAHQQLFYSTRALSRLQPFVYAQESTRTLPDHIAEDDGTQSEISVNASHLTFSTLALALQQIGDKNVLPHVHTSLVFLFCLSFVPEVMKFVESYVPWALLVAFLNTLGKPGVNYSRVEADTFPLPENAYLPEDFVMRGQLWCQQYHPEGFPGNVCPDDNERSSEVPSMATTRLERCLHLRQTALSKLGGVICVILGAAAEAFETYLSRFAGVRHSIFSCSKLPPLFIKLSLLYLAIPLAAGRPIDKSQSNPSMDPYPNSGTLKPALASGSVIDPPRLSIEDVLFLLLAVLSPFAFHLFGKRTGNHVFATGAAMVPANIVHMMTWEGGSVGTVGRLSTFFLAMLATGAFGCHVFRKYPHMGPGHGIAIFFSTLGLVWLCPRGSSSLIGDQTDSSTQYIIPCLAVSLVCWYRLAPFTESYAERQIREAKEASEQAAKAHAAKEHAARDEPARDEAARGPPTVPTDENV